MSKYIYKEGEEVTHIGNSKIRMWVVEIKKKPKCNEKGKEIGMLLIGIKCHWWNKDVLESAMFHSRELVPWIIAEKGQSAIDNFIHGIPIATD